MWAVFAVDPGGVTGCAHGLFEARPTVRECLQDGGEVAAFEVEGDSIVQSHEIRDVFLDWSHGLTRDGFEVHLVFESFNLRTQHADLSPVEVIAGVRTLLHGTKRRFRVSFQSPGDAKGFATSARLRDWSLFAYGRGSEHKRDALRHLALKVNKLLP